jgi:exopolysaccharide production protein ExoZ
LKQKKLDWIESGRGVAALAVVLYHCGNMMLLPQYSGATGLDGLFRNGYLGVDFFFVLSGFIIYLVNSKSLGKISALPNYIIRRLARILPAYWVVLFVGLVLNQILQREKVAISIQYFLGEMFLVNPGDLFVGPAWTLQNELIFYAVFSLFFLSARAGLIGLTLWTALLLATKADLLNLAPGLDELLIKLAPPYLFHFLTGVLVGFWYTSGRSILALLSTLLISTSFVFLFGSDWLPEWTLKFLQSALGFGSVLCTLLVLEKKSIPALPAFVWLGKVSYSLYLVHIFLIGYLFAVLSRLNIYKLIPESLLFFIATGVCCSVAWVCFVTIERPAVAFAQKITAS